VTATGDYGRFIFSLKALLTDNALFVGSVRSCTRGEILVASKAAGDVWMLRPPPNVRPEARLALEI
jgi:hypothetical protein